MQFVHVDYLSEKSVSTLSLLQEQSERPYEVGVQPCSTLFIANLGPNCTEDELKQTLSV